MYGTHYKLQNDNMYEFPHQTDTMLLLYHHPKKMILSDLQIPCKLYGWFQTCYNNLRSLTICCLPRQHNMNCQHQKKIGIVLFGLIDMYECFC